MQLRFFAWERGLSGVDVKFERSSTVALSAGVARRSLRVQRGGEGLPDCGCAARGRIRAERRDCFGSGDAQGWLDKPGACLVVSAQGAARLEIGLRRSSPTGTLDASFQIDNLSGGKAEEETANAGAASLTTSTPREPAVPQLPAEKAKAAPPALRHRASGPRWRLLVMSQCAATSPSRRTNGWRGRDLPLPSKELASAAPTAIGLASKCRCLLSALRNGRSGLAMAHSLERAAAGCRWRVSGCAWLARKRHGWSCRRKPCSWGRWCRPRRGGKLSLRVRPEAILWSA